MFMPFRENAEIAWRKVVDYLLNEDHPDGKDQARILRQHDYNEKNVTTLQAVLLDIARTREFVTLVDARYGVKYTFEDQIPTSSGRFLFLRMVWQINHGSSAPHFVTAYPIARKVRGKQS